MNEEKIVSKEKIRIEIKEIKPKIGVDDLRSCEMGLKVRHVQSKQPVTDNFLFSPQILPSLSDFVQEVRWNSVDKRLFVIIHETPAFSAHQWFSGINDRQANNTDVALDTDVIYLSFLDECDREVARFKFSGISLSYHDCILNRSDCISMFGVDTLSPFLSHSLELSYNKAEQAKREPLEEGQKGIDEEWQTVEVP